MTRKEQNTIRKAVIAYVYGDPRHGMSPRTFYVAVLDLLESHKRQKEVINSGQRVWRPRTVGEWLELFPKWW